MLFRTKKSIPLALSFRQTAMISIRRAHIARLRFDKGFCAASPLFSRRMFVFCFCVLFSPLSAEKSFLQSRSFPIFRNTRRFFQNTGRHKPHSKNAASRKRGTSRPPALYCRSPPQRCAMLRADSTPRPKPSCLVESSLLSCVRSSPLNRLSSVKRSLRPSASTRNTISRSSCGSGSEAAQAFSNRLPNSTVKSASRSGSPPDVQLRSKLCACLQRDLRIIRRHGIERHLRAVGQRCICCRSAQVVLKIAAQLLVILPLQQRLEDREMVAQVVPGGARSSMRAVRLRYCMFSMLSV